MYNIRVRREYHEISLLCNVPPGRGKIIASVPDLPGCVTSGRDMQDAIAQITDAASGWLVVAEDEDLPIPPATAQDALDHARGDVFSLIQIDTLAYRAATDTRAVRKKRVPPRVDGNTRRPPRHQLLSGPSGGPDRPPERGVKMLKNPAVPFGTAGVFHIHIHIPAANASNRRRTSSRSQLITRSKLSWRSMSRTKRVPR